MAELFGVAASAITVAQVAGEFFTSVLTLKKLWDEVRDVPDSINNIVEQLQLLNPVLSEMEAEFAHSNWGLQNDSAARLSIQYCRQAVNDLRALSDDLQRQITSTRRVKRNIAKIQVSIKKDLIRRYQEKLQHAMQILSLSQQTYVM